MVTLYRKYRPQNFKEVVNQNHVKITLQQEIASGNLSHAYLFCGPRAVGKTTIARVLAKAVNCLNRQDGEFEPCNNCESCLSLNSGRSLDIIEMDAASHTGVDNVRENIISASRVAPSQGKYKVFIIDEVHMLSIPAFNALLKTLEEPPASVLFVLCTTEVHKIPATIISRTERFDFKRIGVNDLTKKLKYIAQQENLEIEPRILEDIARHSDGHMRDAESLLGQIVAIGGQKITREEAELVIPRNDLKEVVGFFGCLGRKDASAAIGSISRLSDEGIDLKLFLKDVIELSRRVLLGKINPVLAEKLGLDLGESLEIELSKVSGLFTEENLIVLINRLSRAKTELPGSFIPELPVEIAIIEYCLPKTAIDTKTSFSPARPPSGKTAPPPRTETAPGPEKASGSTLNLNLDTINDKWHEVLAKIKKHNHSLSFILRVCQPRSLDSKQLCLAFKYKFHKDRIGEAGIKDIVEKILKEVYGSDLSVEAVIDEALPVNPGPVQGQEEDTPASGHQEPPASGQAGDPKPDKQDFDNLLKTFGSKPA